MARFCKKCGQPVHKRDPETRRTVRVHRPAGRWSSGCELVLVERREDGAPVLAHPRLAVTLIDEINDRRDREASRRRAAA